MSFSVAVCAECAIKGSPPCKKMTLLDSIRSTSLIPTLLLALVLPARSDSLNWDGVVGASGVQDGGGDWNTTDLLRWYNGTSYQAWNNTTPDSAVFGNADGGAGTINLTSAITAHDLTFNAAGTGTYTIAGTGVNKLTLAGPDVPVIDTNLAAGVNTSITAVVVGTQGFTKRGTGTLVLGGGASNEYTGVTTIEAGTLLMDKTAGLNAVNGDIIISGGTLRWNKANQVANTASITLNSGVLWIAGQEDTIRNLTINGGDSNGGTNSNGAKFTISETLTITGTGSLGTNSNANWSANAVVMTGSGTALTMTGNSTTAVSQFTIGSGGLSITGRTINLNTGNTGNASAQGSRIILNGNVTATGVNLFTKNGTNVGVAQIDMGASTRTWNVIKLIDTNVTTVAISIIGAGAGLTKTGNGNLLLSGADANTYTGLTTVSAGVLQLGKNNGVNAIAGDIQINTGGKLAFTNSDNQIADTATITLNGGTINFNNRTETFANLYLTATGSNVNPDQGNASRVTITGTLRATAGSSISLNSGGQWTVHTSEFISPFTGSAIGLNGNSNGSVNRYTVGIGGSGGISLTGQSINLAKGTNDGGTPATTAKGSELVLDANFTASGSNSINVTGAGTKGVAQVNLNGGQRTFQITSGITTVNTPVVSTTITVDGVGAVASAGGVTKTGTGTLVFAAASTYTGDTRIEAGTFRLSSAGSIDASPVITVASGATFEVAAVSGGYAVKLGQTLQGGGTVLGATTVNDGAILSPGITTGDLTQTLSFTGNLTLADGSETILHLGSPTYLSTDNFGGHTLGTPAYNAYVQAYATTLSGDHDRITSTGTIVQADGAIFTVLPNGFTPQNGQIFNLIDWLTTFTASSNLGSTYRDGSDDDLTDLNLPDISTSGFQWDISHFASHGLIIVVPEPSRAMLLLTGLALVLFSRRRQGR